MTLDKDIKKKNIEKSDKDDEILTDGETVFHPKVWGGEYWIVNKEYCGSIEGGFGGNRGGGTFKEKYAYSLSICTKSTNDVVTLGCLHDNGLKIDNKNCMEVKFKSDDIPDPSKIYIIRNKRFVCEKIEMEVKDDAIEPVYTGYFYMLS